MAILQTTKSTFNKSFAENVTKYDIYELIDLLPPTATLDNTAMIKEGPQVVVDHTVPPGSWSKDEDGHLPDTL